MEFDEYREQEFKCKLVLRFTEKDKKYNLRKILDLVNYELEFTVVNLIDNDNYIYDLYFDILEKD